VALKLVVTKLVCVKLIINLWRSAPPKKTDCKKRLYTPLAAIPGR